MSIMDVGALLDHTEEDDGMPSLFLPLSIWMTLKGHRCCPEKLINKISNYLHVYYQIEVLHDQKAHNVFSFAEREIPTEPLILTGHCYQISL